MNKREDVLYLTLVDFFLQMLFLVMIVLLAYIYVQQQYIKDAQDWEKIAKMYGAKNPEELRDMLSKLAPVTNLKDLEDIKKFIDDSGGLKNALELIKKLKEGQGKPPCVALEDGKKTPKVVAVFMSTDSMIQLVSFEPEFATLAQNIGVKDLNKGMSWSLRGFSSSWQGAVSQYPDCRYTVMLREKSQLVRARDTVQGIFYAQIRR